MRLTLNEFELNCLIKAVHECIMNLRVLNATGSEDYNALVGIQKYLLDSYTLDLTNNLPF